MAFTIIIVNLQRYSLFMENINLTPDYIFESSWEVCNKVGGIYTVLSTRARTLHETMGDGLVFIGPDCWKDKECPFFVKIKHCFRIGKSMPKKKALSYALADGASQETHYPY